MSDRVLGVEVPLPVGVVGRVRADPVSPPFASGWARESSHRSSANHPSVRAAAAGGEGSTPFDGLVRDAARRYGMDEHLIRAVVEAESNFDSRAVSSAGAKGLMQLMDGTARALGVEDPFDPVSNVFGGVKFLRSMLDRFGSVPLALAAYNAGPGAVDEFGGVPPYRETVGYVERVLRLHRRNQSEFLAGAGNGGGSSSEQLA